MASVTPSTFSAEHDPSNQSLSLTIGPQTPELWIKTVGSLIQDRSKEYGDRDAVVVPWQSVRLTYQDLADRSCIVAKAMLEMGIRYGDCVGIIAGNCHQYIEVFLGAARIGCPVVVLNNTYSPDELKQAVTRSGE